MNNLLIAIAVFVITVVAALFAVPHFIDWNSYRGLFEEEAKNVIGREVQVDGDVKLYLLPTPYFRLEKVRIADTSSNLTEHFFKAESLSIKLSIPPLFRGVVEAHEIEFQRPVLRLALDAKGGWNWQNFAQALRSAGYVPANVALASLRIRDGVLALHGSDGVEYARLDGLNGELSAPALEGPYRFRGEFGLGGAKRELRLATGLPEADGSVPFRISLRLPETNASYLVDARAVELMGKTRIKGNLTARLPLPGRSLLGTRRAADGPDLEPGSDAREGFELKAAIEADAASASLSELTLTFDQGTPQVVAGTLRASWRKAVAVEMELASRWLDLDRLLGAQEGAAAIDGIARLAAWARELLPADGRARARLKIERANLGGEAVGQVRLRLAQSASKLQVEDLRLELPGGSNAEIKGDIAGPPDAIAFKGRLNLRGTSAARFLTWATGQKQSIGAKGDGTFEIRTGLIVDAAHAVAPDLAGSLAGTMLSGNLRYRWAGRPELVVALEGPKLDARGLLPDGFNLSDALERLTRTPFAKPAEGRGARAARADFDLRVKAGQLITAARTYRDVSAAAVMKSGHLERLQLRLGGDEGYTLEVEGARGQPRVSPQGQPARPRDGRDRRRHRSAGRAAGRAGCVPSRRQPRDDHCSPAPRRGDHVRRPHANRDRSGGQRRGQRGVRQDRRPLRRRNRRLAQRTGGPDRNGGVRQHRKGRLPAVRGRLYRRARRRRKARPHPHQRQWRHCRGACDRRFAGGRRRRLELPWPVPPDRERSQGRGRS